MKIVKCESILLSEVRAASRTGGREERMRIV